jgi:WD40 repeat protein
MQRTGAWHRRLLVIIIRSPKPKDLLTIPSFIHKQVIPKNNTLFEENTMSKRFRMNLVIAGFLLIISLIGSVTGAGLAHTWKERPVGDGSFSGVMFSTDGSTVYAGGNQILVRSWNGDNRWGGLSGTVATMSADGNRVISAIDNRIRVIDKNGQEIWTRNEGAPIRAVAISNDGSIIIAADNNGYIHSYKTNGERWGRNKTDLVKKIAISPSKSLVVVTSEAGLKFFSPTMDQTWVDNRTGSLDSFIAFSADSATVITSGDVRVSSYTNNGELNWMKDVTQNAIIDMACSDDCTSIVLGSQDGNVWNLNKQGETRWTYPAGSWINGVGVSRDGSVIAAGALDGTLYILDKDGNLLTKIKTDTLIQQRSVAVSRDGKRIVVADLGALYGFDLFGEPEVTSKETITPASLSPATSSIPIPVKTTLPETVSSTIVTTLPETTSTPKSALTPFFTIIAIAGLLFIVMRWKN